MDAKASPTRRLGALALAMVGAAMVLARWLQQGTGNVWTDLDKRLYVPDLDLGWRLVAKGPIWLGLDALALCVGTVVMLIFMFWLAARQPRLEKLALPLAFAGGVLSLLPGIAAFASGSPPPGAVDRPPAGVVEVPTGVQGGLEGLAPGRWELAREARDTGVVATITAGGEAFEGRFAVREAQFRGDPSALDQPLSITVHADPNSVDTGIDGRSSHARKLLQVETHTQMTFRLTQLTGAENKAPNEMNMAALGELELMGDTLPVEVSGQISALQPAARQRLGLTASAAMSVSAQFQVPIAGTKLAEYASDFGADHFPIRVNLILVPSP